MTGNPWGTSYFVTEADGDIGTDIYFKPNLLGGSIEFDVDLSGAGCGCMTSFQLKALPGLNEDGTVRISNGGIPDCRAPNSNNRAKCPEWRLHEANTADFTAWTHSCDAKADGSFVYETCPRDNSCRQKMKLAEPRGEAYGPGNDFVIDTSQEYHQKTEFLTSEDGQ